MYYKKVIYIIFITLGATPLSANSIFQLSLQIEEAQRRGASMGLTFDDGDKQLMEQPIKLTRLNKEKYTLAFVFNGRSYTRTVIAKNGAIGYLANNGKEYRVTGMEIFPEGQGQSKRGCQLIGELVKRPYTVVDKCQKTRELKSITICEGYGDCIDDPQLGTERYKVRCAAVNGVCPDFYECGADKTLSRYSIVDGQTPDAGGSSGAGSSGNGGEGPTKSMDL